MLLKFSRLAATLSASVIAISSIPAHAQDTISEASSSQEVIASMSVIA